MIDLKQIGKCAFDVAVGVLVGIVVLFFLGLILSGLNAQTPPRTQCVSTAVASGTGDAIAIPLLPCSETTTELILSITAANTTTAPTISVNGQTPHVIKNFDSTALTPGYLQPNQWRILTYNGTNWIVLNYQIAATSGGGISSIAVNPCLTASQNPITTSATLGTVNPLTVLCGGTGDASLTDRAVLIGRGTNAVEFATTGTAGRVLTDNGPGVNATFQTPLSVSGGSVEIAMTWPGVPPNSQVVRVAQAIAKTCPSGLTNSIGQVKTAPTGSTVVNVNQVVPSGTVTNRGAMTWSAGALVASPSSSGGLSLAAGDLIEFAFPGAADATAADFAITLRCVRA